MFIKNDLVPFVHDLRKNVIGFDNLFDDLVHRPFESFTDGGFPKDNIIRVDNTVIIELALAGFEKEDITIERDGTRLKVTGNKFVEEVEDEVDVTYIRRNIASRSFTKSYTVGTEYKDVHARFKNGILSIHLEKLPEEEKGKLIEIS